MVGVLDFEDRARQKGAEKKLEAYNASLAQEAREKLRRLGIMVLPNQDPIQAIRGYLKDKGKPNGHHMIGNVTYAYVPGRSASDPQISLIDYTTNGSGVEHHGTTVIVADSDSSDALLLTSPHTNAPVIPSNGKWKVGHKDVLQKVERLNPERVTVTTFTLGETSEPPQPSAPNRRHLRLV